MRYSTLLSCITFLALSRHGRSVPSSGQGGQQSGDPATSEFGLSQFIGHESLPGTNRGLFGAPALMGAQGRSSSPISSANDINAMYNAFQMPRLTGSLDAVKNWYGPAMSPPNPPLPPPAVPQSRQAPPINSLFFPPPQNFQQQPPPPLNDGSVQVSDLSCPNLRSVIGMSNDRNHWLSTVECECRLTDEGRKEFFCYSLCDPPKQQQRCKPNYSILSSCPTYSDCLVWPAMNDTDGGAIGCKQGEAVPESTCWILASSLLREDNNPLRPAFYANAAAGCYATCLCGNDGTVAAQLQCLKAPTSRWTFPIYPRAKKFEFGTTIVSG